MGIPPKKSRSTRPQGQDKSSTEDTGSASIRRSITATNRVTIVPTAAEDVQLVKKTQRGEILLEFRRTAKVAMEMQRTKLRMR